MFCANCGKPLVPGARFCGQCGAVIADPSVTSAPAPSVAPMPANSSTATGGTTILVICAAIGSFLWAAIMFFLVLYQLGLAVTQNSDRFATLGLWNGLIVLLYVGIGIGILMKKKWAWDWGTGSNTLNMVFGIYQLTQGIWVNILLLPVELFIVIALSSTKSVVAPTLTRRRSETPAATVPQHELTDPQSFPSASTMVVASGSTVQGPDVDSLMSWICPCGASNPDGNRFCGRCGKQIAQISAFLPTARPTPLGRRLRTVGAIAIAGLFFVIGILVFLRSYNGQQTATGGPAPGEKPPQIQEAPLPADEAEFVSTLASFKADYDAASNEFLKSTVRRERAAALARILRGRSVDGWIGSVSSMETTGDGNGVLSVRPPGYDWITVKTWNNSLSDIGSGTLIPAGSPLYEQVSHLSVGNKVIFAGTFGSGDLDYLKESSMTEPGSMDDPAFIFTFTSVGTGVVPPKPPSVWIRGDKTGPEVEPEPKAEPPTPSMPPEPIPPVVPPEPPPAPPVKPPEPTSGVLCDRTIELPQYKELTFPNLPGQQLKFTYDHSAWLPTIHKEQDGTQTLTMRSIKPGIQTKCDMRWEIIQ